MAGAALECVHCYSLVHDDLPAMDNDDLRRGRPTAHKAFDDATAILAGDSLLTFAFDILSRPETHASADVRVELVLALARASGLGGMVGGQMLDLAAEGRFPDAPSRRSLARRRDAAGDEDRRADPLRRDGGRDPRRGERGADAPRSTATAPRSARRSRSPTTCSTSRATPRRSARRPARTRPPARRRSSAFSASPSRRSGSRAWSRRPRPRSACSATGPTCSRWRPASSPSGRPDRRRPAKSASIEPIVQKR